MENLHYCLNIFYIFIDCLNNMQTLMDIFIKEHGQINEDNRETSREFYHFQNNVLENTFVYGFSWSCVNVHKYMLKSFFKKCTVCFKLIYGQQTLNVYSFCN